MCHVFAVFDPGTGKFCYETKRISALAEKKRVCVRIT